MKKKIFLTALFLILAGTMTVFAKVKSAICNKWLKNDIDDMY